MARPRNHSRDEFLRAALRIVDTGGLEALTVRRLGAEVGVSYTAFYTYFERLEDVVDGLLDKINDDAIAAATAADGASLRSWIVAVAVGVRRGLAKHPRLLPAYVRSSGRLHRGEAATMAIVEGLEEAGLQGRELVTAYRAIEGYVFGTTVFDHGSAPDHLKIRRKRYQRVGHAAFLDVAASQKSVAEHNEEAFVVGLDRLLTAFGV